MRLGIIGRSDNTGLGSQTKELVDMLNPSKILLIDSSFFNNNKQYPERYGNYNVLKTANGMPTIKEILLFLENIDVVLSCETFYHEKFIDIAKEKNVKTILQYNYELFDHIANPLLTLPDVLAAPSSWYLDDVIKKFGSKSKVVHLPPPTNVKLFNKTRETNLSKDHKKILYIAGKKAAKDRNGTQSVVSMLKHSKEDYELTVKTQTPISFNFNDARLKVEHANPDNRESMYEGFDAMVLPRRYAGLCLPMNEALISGLPVFMTNISPNNAVLPAEWLIDANKIGSFKARLAVDVYDANPIKFAKIIDNYVISNKLEAKQKAVAIGFNNFSVEVLKDKWLNIVNE